ncbi:MAG: response regulator transcription factor [Bacteroidota bacterium]
MNCRILLIEDDPGIGRLLVDDLSEVVCGVDWQTSGEAGLERLGQGDIDLLVLDLMLPGMSGLEVCRQVRAMDHRLPIIMLTAKAGQQDVVRGLELGADDYITKPFSMVELQARIRALFRRTLPAEPAEIPALRVGDVQLDTARHSVSRAGRPVDLTAKEFELLHAFLSEPERTFTRNDLLVSVWGEQFDGFDHTVNTHMNRLRKKIGSDVIRTVWGVGYRLATEDELVG